MYVNLGFSMMVWKNDLNKTFVMLKLNCIKKREES